MLTSSGEQTLLLTDGQFIQTTGEGVELDGQVILDPTQVINSVAEIQAAAAAAAEGDNQISMDNIQMNYSEGTTGDENIVAIQQGDIVSGSIVQDIT